MIQLAGHLKGRALQEWNLLCPDQRSTFSQATEAPRSRVSKSVAAQDFRHMAQQEEERVSDFIRQLERTFRAAYGHHPMSLETRETLLHGQPQDGLRFQLLRGPAVSGARTYQELCIAAKNEEKCLADLKKRQEYSKLHSNPTSSMQCQHAKPRQLAGSSEGRSQKNSPTSTGNSQGNPKPTLKCFYCDKPGHRKEDCRKRKKYLAANPESRGPSRPPSAKKVTTRKEDKDHHHSPDDMSVTPSTDPGLILSPAESVPSQVVPQHPDADEPSPISLLFSDSEEEGVKQICVVDSGSCPQLARVDIHGVPADGIVDTAADITIMGGKLFALVASAARLKKKDFRKPDKVPRNYDGREFQLDGCMDMDMDITFEGKNLATTVYIKMNAIDQLLLSEGVCRQLCIVTYHPSVVSGRTHKQNRATVVPRIRVSLVKTLKLLPSQSAVVPVKLDPCMTARQTLLV